MKKGGPEFVGGGVGPFKFNFRPNLSAKAGGLITVGLFVLIVLVPLYFSFLEYVRPNEFGIKEIQIGINRGIQEKVYEPGFAFVMPFGMQKIHRLPANLQVLEMTDSGQRTGALPGASVRYTRPANIQTSDGFFVTVDATVLYRIEDPYQVVTQLGPEDMYFTQGILPWAEPTLKEALGQLTTEEFYNSPLRVEKAELARDLLKEELKKYGISVEHVLVRYFMYSESIQSNIEDKKLQDQMVFLNQSKKKAAQEQQALNKTLAEGEKQVTLTKEEGEAYRITRQAEEDLYVRTKQAEADLLVELAKAQALELKNEAMQVTGVDRKVAMEMAEVMKGIEVIVLPSGGEGSMNPLDLDRMLEIFGVNIGQAAAPVVMQAPAAGERPARRNADELLRRLQESASEAASAAPENDAADDANGPVTEKEVAP